MTPTPVQRLEASRARLRSAWKARSDKPRTGDGPEAGDGLLPWLQKALAAWWSKHPLNGIAQVAAEVAEPAARSVLAPEAERHPLRLVALAAGAGALVVALRPWRWLPQAALSSLLLTTLWPHGNLQRWLSGGGLSRWLASGELSRLLAGQAAAPAPATPTTPTDAAPPHGAATAAPAAAAAPTSSTAQGGEAASYTAPRPTPMAAATSDF